MNQKKLKKIRKQALVQAVEQGLPYKDYDIKQYRKVQVALDGKVIPYVVYTATLVNCQRAIYKQLKKDA